MFNDFLVIYFLNLIVLIFIARWCDWPRDKSIHLFASPTFQVCIRSTKWSTIKGDCVKYFIKFDWQFWNGRPVLSLAFCRQKTCTISQCSKYTCQNPPSVKFKDFYSLVYTDSKAFTTHSHGAPCYLGIWHTLDFCIVQKLCTIWIQYYVWLTNISS